MEHFSKRFTRGFTMIELMVAVAIIGILAAVAMPQYSQYVRRGKRAEARTVLLQAGLAFQRFYAANDAYNIDRAGTAWAPPSALQQSPSDGTTASANYVWDQVNSTTTGTAYLLIFSPANTMVGDMCGSYTLDQTGARGVLNATATQAECWR